MRKQIVAWYAYAQSGNAAPAAAGSAANRPANRLAELEADGPAVDLDQPAVDLDQPAHVAGLFGDVRQLDLQVDAGGWKHLFSRYGLEGLIDLARSRGGWPEKTQEVTVAEAIVNESLEAGYDPVSGLIGEFKKETRRFEPNRQPAIMPAACDPTSN